MPATVGLIVLRDARSCGSSSSAAASTPTTPQHTATALALYSIGLVAYTGVKVLAPAFYALGTPRVPLLASVVRGGHEPRRHPDSCTARIGYRAIALGTALGSLVNALVLAAVFQRCVGGLLTARAWRRPRCRMARGRGR